jgi:hypothetical protein
MEGINAATKLVEKLLFENSTENSLEYCLFLNESFCPIIAVKNVQVEKKIFIFDSRKV